MPSPASSPSQGVKTSSSKSRHRVVMICAGVVGGSLFILMSVIGIFLVRSSKVVTVKPWVTGLSGQLQKAFVSGQIRENSQAPAQININSYACLYSENLWHV